MCFYEVWGSSSGFRAYYQGSPCCKSSDEWFSLFLMYACNLKCPEDPDANSLRQTSIHFLFFFLSDEPTAKSEDLSYLKLQTASSR